MLPLKTAAVSIVGRLPQLFCNLFASQPKAWLFPLDACDFEDRQTIIR